MGPNVPNQYPKFEIWALTLYYHFLNGDGLDSNPFSNDAISRFSNNETMKSGLAKPDWPDPCFRKATTHVTYSKNICSLPTSCCISSNFSLLGVPISSSFKTPKNIQHELRHSGLIIRFKKNLVMKRGYLGQTWSSYSKSHSPEYIPAAFRPTLSWTFGQKSCHFLTASWLQSFIDSTATSILTLYGSIQI